MIIQKSLLSLNIYFRYQFYKKPIALLLPFFAQLLLLFVDYSFALKADPVSNYF